MSDETKLPMTEEPETAGMDKGLNYMQDSIDAFLETTGVDAVYGPPVKDGDTLVIPTAEVVSTLGFGLGYSGGMAKPGAEINNTDGLGGGGGGYGFSRPVAVIISSPEGVRVEPVVDVTKLGLAALTVFGFMFSLMARIRRGKIS
jgi:uncharacterized spore protein YtfJ